MYTAILIILNACGWVKCSGAQFMISITFLAIIDFARTYWKNKDKFDNLNKE